MYILKFLYKHLLEFIFTLVGFYLFGVLYFLSVDINKPVDEVLKSLGSFIASTGAVVAFLTLLNVVFTKRQDKEDAIIEHANFILFILDRQFKFIRMIKGDIQDQASKFESQCDKSIALTIMIPEVDSTLVSQIDLKESLFVLRLGGPEIFSNLDESQRNFLYLSRIISNRNEIFVNDFHKKVHHVLRANDKFTEEDITELAGSAVVPSLERSTTYIRTKLDSIDREILKVHWDLLNVLQSEYPDTKFIIPSYKLED